MDDTSKKIMVVACAFCHHKSYCGCTEHVHICGKTMKGIDTEIINFVYDADGPKIHKDCPLEDYD